MKSNESLLAAPNTEADYKSNTDKLSGARSNPEEKVVFKFLDFFGPI